MKRSVMRTGLVLLAAVAVMAAGYGGWAVVTVENLPDELTASQPYNLTFSIRQHGVELLEVNNPRIELKSGSEKLVARAVPTNKKGYYTATVNVPSAGDWDATIHTSFGDSKLELMPMTAVAPGARRAVQYTQAERGERLFVAKGCVSCHEHAAVKGSGKYEIGPSLTAARFSAGYLRKFLRNPASKPPTTDARMPNLNLSDADIEALIAFLNGTTPIKATARP